MKCPDSYNFLGKEGSHHLLTVSTTVEFLLVSETEDTLIALVKAQLLVIRIVSCCFSIRNQPRRLDIFL